MWKVPPAGRERTSARTTPWVSSSTSSRTLAEAAPCAPRTARKAFISATAIFCDSNATTAPLRRTICHWASAAPAGAASAGIAAGRTEAAGSEAESKEEIKEALKGADMVFLTAGLGAGTGTGALPVIAKIAHDMNILSVGVVTVPFTFEGARKQKLAEASIKELMPYMDALITVHNDNLLKIKTSTKLTLLNAFRMADMVLRQGIRCVTELILTVGVINVDFADVKSIFQQSDHPDALLGIGESSESAVDAVKEAISSPLVERSLSSARGIILNISGNSSLSLYEVNEASKFINEHTHPDVNIILGTVINDNLGDKVRATIIATDFSDNASPNEEKASTENKDTATKATTDNTVKPKTDDSLKLPDFMNKEKDNKKSSFSAFPFFNFKNDIK